MANGKKKSKKKLFIFGGIGILIIVVVLLVVFGSNKEVIISVQTEDVQTRTITQVVSATGKIQPVEQVVLRPEITGEIVNLPIEEGDYVKKGQLLVRIKPDIYIAQRNRAKASLKSAEANLNISKANLENLEGEYKRIQGLFEKKLASQSEIDAAKASYLQAKGTYEANSASVLQAKEGLKEAEEELAKTTIYSPMNGTITELYVELSERVLGSSFSQGTHMLTVSDLEQMEAIVEVDENDIVLISIGDMTNIEIDAFGDRIFQGKVSQIGNSAVTTGSGTQDEVVNFEVKILLTDKDEKIRPGMSCDADIETDTKFDVLSVPIQSVTARVEQNNNDYEDEENSNKKKHKKNEPEEVVFVVKEQVARQVKVKTGISDDTYIEIIEGLTGDEKVVSGPYRAISKELFDSTAVVIQNKGDNKNLADKEE
ncbi:MAG: efflux RND transporter periplasmic adaptor subunit [Ignavibacteria bacterium]|jgi:HlyD family secretion protein